MCLIELRGHVAKGVDCYQWSFPSKKLLTGSEREVVGRATAKVLTGTCPLDASGRKRGERRLGENQVLLRNSQSLRSQALQA